ncbi:CBS domain-containing protein [Nordella sp. HKS 07]|uniref:CBS domain-containing protein n=1 Tax=Nordella sp. HKS 07 TaxID=2712222 RepID=UPI0013E1A554|nr:CBS domain-containing protein [Nordella sp. HKS 07]QIG50009.1 CBS domain-containing protein [Nordella sp. HKS 07]
MRVGQLSSVTLPRLLVIGTEGTLQAAARLLSNPGVGLVVVCDSRGRAAGVLSKSDLIRYLAYKRSSQASVATLMSRGIIACTPDEEVYAVCQTMAAQRLHKIPVLDADSVPLGILDARDAMRALIEQEQFEERMLSNYISGIGYQ